MLGETFEIVTDRYRFLSEKLQHIPMPIVANCLEGENYRMYSYQRPTLQFRFNGGRGMIEITEHGINDLINHEYKEHITMSMPSIFVKNVIFGSMYVDLGGQVQAVNHKTGERVVIDFY